MNDGEQDSGKSVWQSKLSAAVPEFVPRIARIKVTSSGDLVINSNLSPLVPEFHPSVYFSPSGSSTPRPVHGLQQPSKQTCLKTNKTDLHQAYQTSFPPSTKHIPVKAESSGTEKRKDGSYEGHAVVASGTGESSTGNSVKVKKKKKQRKKNESSGLISKQENTGTHASRDTITGDQLHSDTSLNDDNNVRSKAKEVSSSSQQNGILLLSHHENSSANTDSTLTANFGCCNTVNQPSSLKELYVVSTLTMSYSDKVKSSSPKSNSANNHLGAENTRTNHFTPEGFKRKDKPIDLKKRSEFCYGQSTGTVSSNNDGKKPVKSGQRTDDSSWKTVYRDGDDNKLKDGDSSRSQSTDTKHNQRTLKQMRRNGSFKEATCDDDDNWRVRKDVDPTSVSRKTETTFKSNIKDSNTGYLEKRTCYQEEKIVDLISKGCQDLKHEKVVGHKVVDKKGIASKRRQNFHSIDSCGTELKPSSSFPVSKARSELSEDIQEHEIKPMRMSTIPDADSNSVIAEFPDLKESVKVKRLSVTAGGTMDHKDKVTSPKATTPMSYSAVLRSPPQLKVMHAWENETASKTHGGLLKVPPPQATMAEVENESSQEESNQKRKRKKKKKTKTGDTKEQTQENGSTKRTQKPIQFDLGVMLQTITKSSPDKPQQSNKKLVISTGVLPSQLSVTVSPDTKPVKASLQLKGENKIPHNTLDSTAPVVKRGKERETPARKKPSALKKIILKEREEKKKARETTEFDDADKSSDEKENITFQAEAKITVQEIQNTFEDDAFIQADPKPSSPTHQEIAAEIHSRRFREYCFQVPDKEVDGVATDLLRELVRFQDRQFHKDPVKAKAKRRFVLGLREVHKHLKLRRLKCVIISSNVERIQSSGGLDDTLGSIINLCRENKVPVVFALKRQMLGRVLLKKVPVSIVGIFNYDGAQDHFKKLIELTQKTKQAYTDKWEETREKLELQQKETSGVKTAEMDMVPNAGLAQAGIQHTTKEAAESTGDEESDANKENDSDSEKDDVIIENDFEIQDL